MDSQKEEFLVSNSGIAIIAAFLPQFFEELNMLVDHKFIKDAASTRATLLTQYLIFGASPFPEHGLLLNKIICGVDIEKPVTQSFDISFAEDEQVENLLNSVLTYWVRLGNTTIEGLRTNFLIRSGRIYEASDSWTLKVEPKSLDMLLDALPWVYSPIMLPWMKKPLIVDWR